MRAFGPNVDRIVRRATIVYSADDIRRNITLRLQDGQPCVLELGDDIVVTAGFTIPGGLRAFSIDGAQRYRFLVDGVVPFLFYAKGAELNNGCPVDIVNVEVLVKSGATLTTVVIAEQFSAAFASTEIVPYVRFVNLVVDASAGTCTNLVGHGSFVSLGTRNARLFAQNLYLYSVDNVFAVDDNSARWAMSSIDGLLLITGPGGSTIGAGAASADIEGTIMNVLGDNVSISVGDNSRVAFISCDTSDYVGNSGPNTLLRVRGYSVRTLGPNEVDLDNLGGGGGAPTNATYVTLSTDATLTQERVLTAGSGISIVDGGAGSTVTISASGGGASLTAATITVPFGLQARTVSVVDAGATALSKVIVAWGNTVNTDENQPSASNVTFSAVGAAGSVAITVSSNNSDNVGGAYKVLYILG
jgi:hypothetical protein